MRRCWDSLNDQYGFNAYTEYPRATHKYVVFKTRTWNEYNTLVKDTNTDFSDYPLNYNVTEGEWYHGDETPIDSPTYQYAVVPLDYNSPSGVNMSEIEELYIPEKDPLANNSWANSDAMDELEIAAYNITGNSDELISDNPEVGGRTNSRQRWHPSGSVKYFDENLNTDVPVQNVKIRVRTRFGAYTLTTDENGNFYSQHSTKKKVRFVLRFDGPYWDIRRGTYGQAKVMSGRRREPYNFYFTSGIRKAYCITHVAAYDYYFKYAPFYDLEQPPTFWHSRPVIGVNHGISGWGVQTYTGSFRTPDLFSACDILIGHDIYTTEAKALYGTVVHELTHAQHWDMSGNHNHYNSLCSQIKESWARGVQWLFVKTKYSTAGVYYNAWNAGAYPGNGKGDFQPLDVNEGKNKWYTSFMIDLYDGDKFELKDNSTLPGGSLFVKDEVYGYSWKQIETAVRNSSNFEEIRDYLQDNYQNNTEDKIDVMVEYWGAPACDAPDNEACTEQ